MLVTQKIGEAGQYGFGFAGKYRGRADDSVRIGRLISENQNRSKAEHQVGICYSAEITCKGIVSGNHRGQKCTESGENYRRI